ncbi:MAG: reverse transcriptase domain-containing protein [Myxococcota bacterium]|nr:reverse transcriptase domain-containing protein [Myxococcota bacterium]
MLTARTIRKLEGIHKCTKTGRKVENLFKIITTSPDLWLRAYSNIASNKGAMTKGVDNSTVDGFSKDLVADLIKQLRTGKFRFQPVRRTYIPKSNGKLRPLGIPTFKDKLVQEVCKIVLETVYEPVFHDSSHGFRKSRSAHTALDSIKSKWAGTTWFVEFDIRGCFDNICHQGLVEILEKKISDRRFIKLIHGMLKAGYMEDWRYHATWSGTPQGGIASPVLANIYLHELDCFVEEQLIKSNNKDGNPRRRDRHSRRDNPKYRELKTAKEAIRRKIAKQKRWLEEGKRKVQGVYVDPRQLSLDLGKPEDLSPVNPDLDPSGLPTGNGWGYKPLPEREIIRIQKEKTELIEEFKRLSEQQYLIPCLDPHDPSHRRLRYVRYADDFLIGFTGPKDEAVAIFASIQAFLDTKLKLQIAPEKSGIKHARKEGTRFLSYDVFTSNYNQIRRMKQGAVTGKRKVTSKEIRLEVPKKKVSEFCKTYGNPLNAKAIHRPYLLHLDDVEILFRFNAEIRGFANYYRLANDVKSKLSIAQWMVSGSYFRTLACKHKSTVRKISKRLKQGTEHVYVDSKTSRSYSLFKLTHLESWVSKETTIDEVSKVAFYGRSSLVDRLSAKECEYCGQKEGYFEVHHVRHLKDLGKNRNPINVFMAARARKTIVLCTTCHKQLHFGNLPDLRYMNGERYDGEPYAFNGARTVRRGAKGTPS